ncbi:hypothetical protein BK138_28015 [Paenibacillus rhizosphaerae]|uniref:HAMP domain-containing protein n=2 Tax=Paenibacillus TaxID=44249 RepID=A0A1R1EE97_9BACL|nr:MULTISPECIES: hypothetical protein [Paenibacillus]OMF50136.1 hypothetical protein BK138_28015 [Paenibacillus rhizosphaerae]GIO57070.1 hypothetical protein J21TS7_53880 [Paenibacillus cineris]
MRKWLTVRTAYLYTVTGSALLSGIVLFLTYRVFVWSYAHVSPDSFFARLARGLVNYIGRTPIAAVVFLIVFAGLFMFRSQKLADDMKQIVRAAEELADRGSFRELKVASGGELKALASHLQGIRRWMTTSLADRISTPPIQNETTPLLDNEEVMAVILRIKSLLRTLEAADLDSQRLPDFDMESVKREAQGLERLLESLMTAS